MLQAINDRIKGWLGAAIVILIGLPFAFWGIQSYITGGKASFAAKVNDFEISEGQLDSSVSQQRQKLMQQLGGQLPFDDAFLKKQVLDQLINRKLVESSTFDAGYRVSDNELTATIVKGFNDNGQFDRDTYERELQARRTTAQQFEYELRNDIRVTQMRAALINTSFVTDKEVRKLIEIEDQEREASLLIFNVKDYQAGLAITEEEVQAAYESESDRYMLPEKVSIDYIELKNEYLASNVSIDEQQLRQLYDDYVADVGLREKRRASHILLKLDGDKEATRKRLEDIRQQILSGASFEELAAQYSQDPGSARQGGDLGWVEPGQMVKPFEDALFELNDGEISEPVESEFGFHLIRLTGIESEKAEPFEKKRAELEAILRQEAAANEFYDLTEVMATTAYENPDSLDAVADALGIEIKTTELFTRSAGTGIAANGKIRNAAFSSAVLQDGANSDIIELADNHAVVLRVHEHQPASLRSLQEVRAVIENNLRLQKANQLALQAALQARERIEKGEAIENVISGGQVLDKPGRLKRNDTGKIDQQVLNALFEMPRPESGQVTAKEVPLFNGDVVLIVLQKLYTPEQIDKSRVDTVKAQLRQDAATQDFSAALLSLRESADIYLNPNVLEK